MLSAFALSEMLIGCGGAGIDLTELCYWFVAQVFILKSLSRTSFSDFHLYLIICYAWRLYDESLTVESLNESVSSSGGMVHAPLRFVHATLKKWMFGYSHNRVVPLQINMVACII